MRMWVWSLSLLCGLRIQHCSELWWRLQAQLGSGFAVAVTQASNYSSVSTSSLRTPICRRCSPRKQKKKRKKKEKKRNWIVLGCIQHPLVSVRPILGQWWAGCGTTLRALRSPCPLGTQCSGGDRTQAYKDKGRWDPWGWEREVKRGSAQNLQGWRNHDLDAHSEEGRSGLVFVVVVVICLFFRAAVSNYNKFVAENNRNPFSYSCGC